jgi:hypothetical protein
MIIDRRSAISEPVLNGLTLHSAALPPLLNPLAPLSPLRHAAIFELFPPWEGLLEKDVLIDFLGVRTPFEYDCEGYTADEMRRATRLPPIHMHVIPRAPNSEGEEMGSHWMIFII